MNRETFNSLDKLIERAYEVIGKKLTTKQRKQMKKATFCGPNRSFPVPDCEHVRVAKTYLKRSNFSRATQQRIAACINRKAKALGCPGEKPAKAKGELELALMDSPIFESTKLLVEESIENPGMELEWSGWDECLACEEEAQKNNQKKATCGEYPASSCAEVKSSLSKVFKSKDMDKAEKKRLMKCLATQSQKLDCMQKGMIEELASLLEIAEYDLSDFDFEVATVCGSRSLPTTDKASWDGSGARARMAKAAGGPDKEKMNWTKYGKGFVWCDPAKKNDFGGYKLPFADIIGGKLTAVWGGVRAAMAAVHGARGGTKNVNVKAAHSLLASYYKKFDKEVPKL